MTTNKTSNFELIKSQEIPALNLAAKYYKHLKTGAQLLSMECDDENKVFGITFRTPPENSTGIAHIMEHSVLCGSEKYPLKEPFIELVKGSLNTFLNAFTYPDKTCYPVASQNLKDFYNLIDVYMDAVFHPLLSKYTFMQEGWHYEIKALEEPLKYKGVVYNEMKGAYSDPDNLLSRWVQHSLFPNHVYGIDSGGDPREIPNLTYQEFLAFHKNFYNPSNAYIYFFGNDDPDERLRLMDEYLSAIGPIDIDSSIPKILEKNANGKYVHTYDSGDEKKGAKGYLVQNWLLPEPTNPIDVLELQILAHILLGTPASPLRKALIESGYGEDLAGIGLETELKYMFFSTGLKGIPVDEQGRLEYQTEIMDIIKNTLQKLVDEGISSATIEASMNTIEFHLRENNTGSFPQGLNLMLRTFKAWLYEGDPIEAVNFEIPLKHIKRSVAKDTTFFEQSIRRYFLENPHQTTVILLPENGLQQRMADEERQHLKKIKRTMSKSQLRELVQLDQELERIQDKPDLPENLDRIPVLSIDDLDKQNKEIPIQIIEIEESKVLFHDIFTNGILYFDVGMNLRLLSAELIPYVPLFARSLIEIGTEDEDYVKFMQRIGRQTGGFTSSIYTTLRNSDKKEIAWLFLRGKATVEHVKDLLDILSDMLLKVAFDNKERFLQMLFEEKISYESALVPAGHRFVNGRIRSNFNLSDSASEMMSGIEYVYFLRDLIEEVQNDWQSVLAKLEQIRQLLVNAQTMVFNVTLDEPNFNQLLPRFNSLIQSLPSFKSKSVIWEFIKHDQNEGFILPAEVNYVGKGANLYRLGYSPDGSISVITNYLRTTYLWEQVRVKGGAYGGFCVFDYYTGIFSFLSYRDPNLLKTIISYDNTVEYLRTTDINKDTITRSIIGAIGNLDMYQLPDAKGYTSMIHYLAGVTKEDRQLWRNQILKTTEKDFRNFADVLYELNEQAAVVVLGSRNAIQAANERLKSMLTIKELL